MITDEKLASYDGLLMESINALVDAEREAAREGKHIHYCFACGQPYKCKCSRPKERLICGPCDGEVF